MTLPDIDWKPNSCTGMDESRVKHGKHANSPCVTVTIHIKEREQRSGQYVDSGILIEKLYLATRIGSTIRSKSNFFQVNKSRNDVCGIQHLKSILTHLS